MNTYRHLLNTISGKGAALLILIDPDRTEIPQLPRLLEACNAAGADGYLVGGSLLLQDGFEDYITQVKKLTKLPVIIFPGSVNQVNKAADAILFLSVISGRNADDLIGKHVIAAPMISKCGIEPISTGYMIIESGSLTTALYMSGSHPIPRHKPEIAAATALAGEYLGMQLIYLEAGSGADVTVPDDMVKAVTKCCRVPVVVGGGIKNPAAAHQKVINGAGIIVIGNFFENENNWELVKEFADAVHIKSEVPVK